jgi:hypothetical protein
LDAAPKPHVRRCGKLSTIPIEVVLPVLAPSFLVLFDQEIFFCPG